MVFDIDISRGVGYTISIEVLLPPPEGELSSEARLKGQLVKKENLIFFQTVPYRPALRRATSP